jgi:hypothetical protein
MSNNPGTKGSSATKKARHERYRKRYPTIRKNRLVKHLQKHPTDVQALKKLREYEEKNY